MPHVVFDKKISLDKFSTRFKEKFLKNPCLIKLKKIYLDKEKRSALVSVIVIGESHQEFFIEIMTRDDKTTLRFLPVTDPVKTSGVKFSLGLLAHMILEYDSSYVIVKTNIREFMP